MLKIIFSLILFCVLISCAKSPEDMYIDSDILHACNVDTGSVFVFQDSITNETDTLIVIRSDWGGHEVVQEHQDYYVQTAGYYLESKNEKPDSTKTHIRVSAGKNYIIAYYSVRKGNIALQQHPFILLYSSSLQHWITNIDYPFVTTVENTPEKIWESILIKSKAYPSVYENYRTTFISDSLPIEYFHSYYSADSALVKFEIKTTNSHSVRELVYAEIKKR